MIIKFININSNYDYWVTNISVIMEFIILFISIIKVMVFHINNLQEYYLNCTSNFYLFL